MINNKDKYNAGNVVEDAITALDSENKAIDILSQAFPKTLFKGVHNEQSKWHKGDIEMIGDGFVKYIDIKEDGSIHRTRNVFCENYKYFHSNPNKRVDGFMESSNYDLLGVLDDIEKNLYIFDFKALKRIYKNYELKKSYLSDCNAWGNCVPLRDCKEKGILVFQIRYSDTFDIKILEIRNFIK